MSQRSNRSNFKSKKTSFKNENSLMSNQKVPVTFQSKKQSKLDEFQSEKGNIDEHNKTLLDSLYQEEQQQQNQGSINTAKREPLNLDDNDQQKLGSNTMSKNLVYQEPIQNKQKEPQEQEDMNEEVVNLEEQVLSESDNENQEVQKRKIENVKNENEDIKNMYNVFLNRTQQKYSEEPDINLMVLVLKKMIKDFHNENQLLKKMNLELEQKNTQNISNLKLLQQEVEILELEQTLMNEQPSKHVKFELDELDNRLVNMDNNLTKATTNNAQEQFLQDIVEQNKVFEQRNEENSGKMRNIKKDLIQLHSTLENMNNQKLQSKRT